MEHKQTDALVTDIDEEQGIVEAIWAVMGNVDEGLDRIHSGAFTKTFAERGNKVALLDNHRTDSVMSALGTVLALKEINEGELPAQLKTTYPDATGGAWGQFQFLTETPEGKGAFTRIKKGAVKQWSFGYDALDKDYSTEETKDGEEITIRNLRTIKLYEVSPVLFAMNEATTTTGAKNAPTEGKPYGIFKEDGQYAVYKVDENGDKTGERLGLHDTEGEAEAQRRALYAREEGDGKDASLMLSTKQHSRVRELIKELSTIFDHPVEDDNSEKDEAPDEEQAATEAGPPETPTSTELLTLIEIEQQELELMEV